MKTKRISDGWLAVVFIAILLIVDQWIKITVKTSMCLGERLQITDWFYIYFIENRGMAFGIELFSKLFLSLFRFAAIIIIGWYICRQIKQHARTGYVMTLPMILAGAAGNLIDCMFYGMIFSGSSPYYVSYFVPFGTGYAPFMMGKVVDMFYFPLFSFDWPSWMPMVGGQEFVFFSPIFNFADSCVTVGFFLLLIFFRRELNDLSLEFKKKDDKEGNTEKENISSEYEE